MRPCSHCKAGLILPRKRRKLDDMTDILQEICDRKRTHVADKKATVSLAELKAQIQSQSSPRGFEAALRHRVSKDQYGFICEVKKASPSKGLIREDFDPATLAAAYEKGGATCLSVLTDEPYFQGHDTFLKAAREACALPVLRKDFMVDIYQVFEARALGADCILIIMAALSDAEAIAIEDVALDLGMDVLIEVHNEDELERAAKLQSKLIGVNNRNLKTMTVSLDNTLNLVPRFPDNALAVAESGLKSPDDLTACATVGANCFLIGETFMRQDDVTEAVRALQKGAAA